MHRVRQVGRSGARSCTAPKHRSPKPPLFHVAAASPAGSNWTPEPLLRQAGQSPTITASDGPEAA
ncbi:hypothetical protein [Streptomyces sp. NPDC008240]|uniref:hypothetical protein n=1 Tax=Streptomyces sp. NPDC008240 TaxID=3364822 RepID=UPI0036EC823F